MYFFLFFQKFNYHTLKHFHIKWLLDKMEALIHGLFSRLFDVAGHEDYFQAWILSAEHVGKLATGHPGHYDIGQQQIDLPLVLSAHFKRLGT